MEPLLSALTLIEEVTEDVTRDRHLPVVQQAEAIE
jgi:hypothetical protein